MILLLQEAAPALDQISDALVPVGGAALIVVCLRLAVTAYKDALTIAREREKICTETLSASTLAIAALTAEVKTINDGHREHHELVKISLAEIREHYRRHEE